MRQPLLVHRGADRGAGGSRKALGRRSEPLGAVGAGRGGGRTEGGGAPMASVPEGEGGEERGSSGGRGLVVSSFEAKGALKQVGVRGKPEGVGYAVSCCAP